MVHGFSDRVQRTRRESAWALSYQLIAAGCKPEHVTVAKLLGEELEDEGEAAEKLTIDEIFRRMTRIPEKKEPDAAEQ